MDTDTASAATMDSVADDVDNYDWNEYAFKPTREEIPQASQPKEARPNTPTKRRFSRPLPAPESFDEIKLRLSNEFPPVIEEDYDTLVYIGVPPPTPGQDPYEVDYTERLFRRPYLMKSSTLRATQSPKFEKFLGPMSARTARKLKKMDFHRSVPQPNNIKYYIDLSPILNDEEALIQITELTVPNGALKWHQVAKPLGIPASHIGGRDELNVPPKRPYTLLVSEESSDDPVEEVKADEGMKVARSISEASKDKPQNSKRQSLPPPPVVDLPLEEEYTALRHHTATARILQALAENDPKLNSAAKAWTFCMLAKYFDCAHSPVVSHWIVAWLLESGNSHFIQNNPEVAYRMAVATQSVWLMRCTFAIMVGRQAMIEGSHDLLSSNAEQPKSRRPCHAASCLDDDDINRIDHAAAALTRRVRETLEEVVEFPGIWNVEASPNKEIAKLNRLSFEDAEHKALLLKVKDQVKNYVRRMIYMTLSASYDLENVKSIGPFKGFGRFATYTDIPQPLRLLTQHFWHILRLEQFARDYTDTYENRQIWTQTQTNLKELGIITGSDIPYVSRKILFTSLEKLNYYLSLQSKHGLSTNHSASGRTVTPECSSPAKKIKLSPDARQHSCSLSEDLDPLLQKLSSSFISPVSPEGAAAYKADSLKSTAAPVVEEDDDWQDTMDNIHPLGGSPPTTLPIRQKSSALTAQATLSSSRSVPFGTDTKTFYGLPAQGLTAISASSQQGGFVPVLQSTIGNNGRSHAQKLLQQNLLISAENRQSGTENIQASRLSDAIPYNYQGSQSTSSTLYDRPSSSTSKDTVSPIAVPKHERTLQPHESAFLESFEDENKPNTHPWYSRFFRRRTSSLAPANDSDWETETHPTAQNQADFDTFFRAAPPPLFPLQSRPELMQHEHRTSAPLDPEPLVITPAFMLDEISKNLYNRIFSIITPGYVLDGTCDFDIPNGEISTLLCLNDNEWKYLPLWAGGLDDGTGGVFNDGVEVPDAPDVEDGGFRGGAMGIIPGVGSSVGGSMDGSEFEEIMTEVGVSTVGKASRNATDGTATETVISLDE